MVNLLANDFSLIDLLLVCNALVGRISELLAFCGGLCLSFVCFGVLVDLAVLCCSLLVVVLCLLDFSVLERLNRGVVVVDVLLLVYNLLLSCFMLFDDGVMLDGWCDFLLDCGVFLSCLAPVPVLLVKFNII